MSQQKFVDRQPDLECLERQYKRKGASLFIIYGRRRIGKTELIRRFLENKQGIYFLATLETEFQNIKALKELFSKWFGEYFKHLEIRDWFNLFKILVESSKFKEITKNQKFILVIDEFSYLIQLNKGIPSIFQKIWDELLEQENIMLILCGSSVSLMETEVLGYKSPLYGRRTGQLEIGPLEFKYLKDFLPKYDIEDLVKTWFVVGGIPAYLKLLDPNRDFWKNIKNNFLLKEALLYKEAEFLLTQEFREPKNYKLILKSIALGNHTLGEICNYSGLDKSMVSKYLDVLSNLKIIRELVPVTASPKFKKRHYVLSDQYFNFYFRYIYPNIMDLEIRNVEQVLSKIKTDFSNYSGFMFEFFAEDIIRHRYFLKDFNFSRLGKYWDKNVEIDLLDLNESSKKLLAIECKWKDNIDPKKICKSLIDKLDYVQWYNNERKEYLCIFTKSFKEKINEFEGYKVFCYDLKDIEKFIRKQK